MPVSMVGRAGELAELDSGLGAVVAAAGPAPTRHGDHRRAGRRQDLLVAAALERSHPAPCGDPLRCRAGARARPRTTGWRRCSPAGHQLICPYRRTLSAGSPSTRTCRANGTPRTPCSGWPFGPSVPLVGDGPAVLIVEDLHALDPASLNLVGELATTSDLSALLRGHESSSRPLPSRLRLTARTLARLSGAPGAVRQHLGPLRLADVGEVLTQAYAGTSRPSRFGHTRSGERTCGNPYALTELLATAAPGGAVVAARSEPMPTAPRA